MMPSKSFAAGSRVNPTTPLQLARCHGVLRYLGILCIDGSNGAVLEHKLEHRNIVPVVCCDCSQVHGCPALEHNSACFDLLPSSKVHACRAKLRFINARPRYFVYRQGCTTLDHA